MSTVDFSIAIQNSLKKAKENTSVQEKVLEMLDLFTSQLEKQLRTVYGQENLYVSRQRCTPPLDLSIEERAEYFRLTGRVPVAEQYDAIVIEYRPGNCHLEICSYQFDPENAWPITLRFHSCVLCVHDLPSLEKALEQLMAYQVKGIVDWLNTVLGGSALNKSEI